MLSLRTIHDKTLWKSRASYYEDYLPIGDLEGKGNRPPPPKPRGEGGKGEKRKAPENWKEREEKKKKNKGKVKFSRNFYKTSKYFLKILKRLVPFSSKLAKFSIVNLMLDSSIQELLCYLHSSTNRNGFLYILH